MKGIEISDAAVQNEQAGNALEKAENSRKSRRVLDGPTELYRHFDADGYLLYVGISLTTIGRLANHRNVAPWFRDIVRIDIQRFATRHEALDAEFRAIRDELPLHNREFSRRAEMEAELEEACAAMTADDWAALHAN
jgi:hypothetical protein